MDERRKYALLFAATILVARKLHEIGSKPCPAREFAIAEAIEKAEAILKRIEERAAPRYTATHMLQKRFIVIATEKANFPNGSIEQPFNLCTYGENAIDP